MCDCDFPNEIYQVDQIADLEEPILPWSNFQKYFKLLRVIESNFFIRSWK